MFILFVNSSKGVISSKVGFFRGGTREEIVATLMPRCERCAKKHNATITGIKKLVEVQG